MNKPASVEIMPVQHMPVQHETSTAVTPLDMLNRAVSSGADIEVLERLMALNERSEAARARKAFDEAVAAAKANIPPIVRNREGHNKRLYADFAAIARAVDPVIAANGLSYRFRTKQDEHGVHVSCILSHKAGHSEETTLSGPPDQTGNKNAIQAIGSTLTYLQRYSLIQALGLAAADDDDGRASASAQKISADEAQNIRDKLKASGASEAKFLKWAKVEKIEDIAADFYDSCCDAIGNFKKAAS